MRPFTLFLVGTAFAAVTQFAAPADAQADPCEGPLPKTGAKFSGPVRYVADGDGLCVGEDRNPATWVEVRLANFYAPELNAPGGRQAKAALEAITRGQTLQCVAGRRSWDRVVATCTLNGIDVGEIMRRRGIVEGGNGRR